MGNRFYKTDLAERFWPKVEKGDTCWLWQGTRDKKGYGQINRGAHTGNIKAHRAAWLLTKGPIPKGLNVLHKCDNPPCVRPDHLFLGTFADNSQDAARKGRLVFQAYPERAPVGERVGGAKLKDVEAQEIRRLYQTGDWSQPQLARRYGVSQAAIWYVLHRRKR